MLHAEFVLQGFGCLRPVLLWPALTPGVTPPSRRDTRRLQNGVRQPPPSVAGLAPAGQASRTIPDLRASHRVAFQDTAPETTSQERTKWTMTRRHFPMQTPLAT